MRVAPVVDGQVVLSAAGCWLEDRPTHAFPGPLAEIPEATRTDALRREASRPSRSAKWSASRATDRNQERSSSLRDGRPHFFGF